MFSQFQSDIFQFVTNGRGSAVVEAVAGGGKTTTIVECAKLLPKNASAVFVAFNKNIAEELKQRLPGNVRAMTMNSMGYGTWFRSRNGVKSTLDVNKMRSICDREFNDNQRRIYGQGVCKLVALAKSIGLVPEGVNAPVKLAPDAEQTWIDLITKYDIEFEEGGSVSEGIDLARGILIQSINCADKLMDFDDQLYLPVIFNVRFWQNDWMFVDEAQDVNAIQRAMLKRALKPGGRLIAVGDPCQAIYGFRGADTEAIAHIKKEFGAITLPLSVSYRCPQAVVREAQRFVHHIQASGTAPMGKVDSIAQWDAGQFQPTDALLCRNTAPLISTAYAILRKGRPCRVLGREIGQGLISLIKKMKAGTDVDRLLEKLQTYQERETAKFMSKGQEQKAEALADKVDTIRIFVEQLPEEASERTIPALVKLIESLFSDAATNGITTLCTIHKSKGLEWPRVFIVDPWRMPSKFARQDWQLQQETNLQYVAVTRAKEELYYIDAKGMKRD